ncbi:MAG: hypothetical protein FJ313_00805 [Gemmatimonadetes bacterium]|nr:hypothetical protein [Gemmatimonadota bacterium]
MPLTTGSPVEAVPAREADIFEVTGINIRNEDGTVTIYWRKSLSQEGGEPQVVETGPYTTDAAGLGALYPDGSKTYYENLKALAYQVLQDAGVFPEGELV